MAGCLPLQPWAQHGRHQFKHLEQSLHPFGAVLKYFFSFSACSFMPPRPQGERSVPGGGTAQSRERSTQPGSQVARLNFTINRLVGTLRLVSDVAARKKLSKQAEIRAEADELEQQLTEEARSLSTAAQNGSVPLHELEYSLNIFEEDLQRVDEKVGRSETLDPGRDPSPLPPPPPRSGGLAKRPRSSRATATFASSCMGTSASWRHPSLPSSYSSTGTRG